MKTSPTNTTVILFDMDDTLAATSTQWRQAETALLASLGRPWDAELAKSYKGMNALDVAATVYRQLSPAGKTAKDCQAVMRKALFDAFNTSPPAPMQGCAACVRRLGVDHRMAVASGSPLELIDLTLKHLQISDCFDLRISSESVSRGKPHPDVFLAAAEHMQVEPARCIVIEDSLIGVQAAISAGMHCIAIPSSSALPFESLAHRVCKSLNEVDAAMVRDVMEK